MMVRIMRTGLHAVLMIGIWINCVVGERLAVHMLRQNDVSLTGTGVSIAPTQTQSSSTSEEDESHTSGSTQPKTSTSASKSSSETIVVSSTSTQSAVQTSVIPNINGASSSETLYGNASVYNATATPDKLPVTPRITPAYSIAGVLLIVSGIAFALVGIKNRLLHISLSAIYLASLAVTVLILYVMNPPVSNAIQGAYFVAIFLTGCVVGGVAILFTELTECLGCLFGGFCFSMWLLVLKPGGILHSTAGVSAFIAAFTLASFSTFFSKLTRPYGLMFGTSFGGSTSVIIGIDCFSRSGLKEFWAYIWNVSLNLFPLGTNTFPHTRGIKVEIAGIIIFFIAGMISQMKIWKMVERRREKRAADNLEDERLRAEAEERRGRRIEDRSERDRQRWEAVYGDVNLEKAIDSRDSGIGDMDGQKKGPRSMAESVPSSKEENIELQNISPRPAPAANVMMMKAGHESRVTVRVASESGPPQIIDEDGSRTICFQGRPSYIEKPVSTKQNRTSAVAATPVCEKRNTFNSPDIVPLPFKVPDDGPRDDRSSIATFADDVQMPSKRHSGNRLSATGTTVLRKLSGRSHKSSERLSVGNDSPSTEELVRSPVIEDDRASSLAATMDELSDYEEAHSARSSMAFSRAGEREPNTVGLTEEACQKVPQGLSTYQDAYNVNSDKSLVPAMDSDEAATQQASATSENPKDAPEGEVTVQHVSAKSAGPATSTTSAMASKPLSLTKDQLPAQCSKVVMSYRTNEWAKHLEAAETPELEDLGVVETSANDGKGSTIEVAAHLDIEELQQTSLSPPGRTTLQISRAPKMSRSSSTLSTAPSSRPEPWGGESPVLYPSSSQQSLQLSNRPLARRSSFAPSIPQQIVESPIEQNYTPNHPYGNNSGAMKRESLLRGNSQLGNYTLASTPALQMPKRLSTRSSYANMGNRTSTTLSSVHDDKMSMAQRRTIIRQSSQGSRGLEQESFDSHQPQWHSSVPDPRTRENQLASWRTSMQDTKARPPVTQSIERQRSVLWNERQAEAQRRAADEQRRAEKDNAFDQRMRTGSMLEAHRVAMRKMQASANKHVNQNNNI
ncbi:hypothetical protein BJ878DRAFT_516018 [Calycina marina]|uniref:TM7S3/TM198-like domain-containing protein n=1 Tax=Calycina marina TaxID=1763456 RepID=A0A9P8CD84_9HELO|nr:hypothetical protein BJ878DRAFT_516018 [Calycina marina]